MPLSPIENIALEIAKLTTDANEQKQLIESYYYFMKETVYDFTPEAVLELIKLYKPLSKTDRDKVKIKFKATLEQVNQAYDKISQSSEDEEDS